MLLLFLIGFALSKPKFMFGASTAAYQIEGGVDSRGKNNWDVFSHIPGKIYHNENGDVADDSYNRFEEDLDLLAELGVGYYRFSISWSRIFPNNNFTSPDPVGVKYYSEIIDGCYRRGIYPLVTLYHWDLPVYLDWLEDDVIDAFVEYSRTCFQYFGNRVLYWLTFNEPLSFTVGGFGSGNAAPGRCSNRTICTSGNSSTEPYIVGHNALIAHAKTYRMYEKEFKEHQKGEIGMALNLDNSIPYTSSEENIEAANRGNEFRLAWFGDPVYFGDYPEVMKKYVGSRLPNFSSLESDLIRGSVDFFALNHYTTAYAIDDPRLSSNDWFSDQRVKTTYIGVSGKPIGERAASEWLYVYPQGLRETLNWVSERYNNPRIIITENGVDAPGEDSEPLQKILNDTFRINYLKGYLEQLILAKEIDKVNIEGYFCWSVIDNFEWGNGYSKKFGLVYVDRENDLKRIKKDSFFFYKEFIEKFRDL